MAIHAIEREFVADHRHLTQALRHLIDAIASDDGDRITAAARTLDEVAGPHIAFEEQWLHPLVTQARGEQYSRWMKEEQREVVAALKAIRAIDPDDASSTDKNSWIERLRTGLNHVATCGTLLSFLTVLDEPGRTKLSDALHSLKEQHLLWTHLPSTEPGELRDQQETTVAQPQNLQSRGMTLPASGGMR